LRGEKGKCMDSQSTIEDEPVEIKTKKERKTDSNN